MTEGGRGEKAIQGIRIITGLLLGSGTLAFLLLAPRWSVALVLAAIAGLGMGEYIRLSLSGHSFLEMTAGITSAAAVPLAGLIDPAACLAALSLGLAACLGAVSWNESDLSRRVERLARLGWGILYLGGSLSCLLILFALPDGRYLLIFLVAAVVAADSGAYFCGMYLGRHKMSPSISPNKTLEGLAGGLVMACGVGAGLGALMLPELGAAAGALLGLALGGLGVLGDLLESLLKRAAGVKDSGNLLPGHGGVLDRVDALLLAGPGLLLARMLWQS